MTKFKTLQCKQCGLPHEIEVTVHAGDYAEAQALAALIVSAADANPNTKALAAVLVLRWLLAKYHAPADWLVPLTGLYADLADNVERNMSMHN